MNSYVVKIRYLEKHLFQNFSLQYLTLLEIKYQQQLCRLSQQWGVGKKSAIAAMCAIQLREGYRIN